MGLVVNDFLVVKLLNNQCPKSNNQKNWLLRRVSELGILGDLRMLIDPNSLRQLACLAGGSCAQKKHVPLLVDLICNMISGFLKSTKMRNLARIWVHHFLQPVMFDVDQFGDKKVLSTKYIGHEELEQRHNLFPQTD